MEEATRKSTVKEVATSMREEQPERLAQYERVMRGSSAFFKRRDLASYEEIPLYFAWERLYAAANSKITVDWLDESHEDFLRRKHARVSPRRGLPPSKAMLLERQRESARASSFLRTSLGTSSVMSDPYWRGSARLRALQASKRAAMMEAKKIKSSRKKMSRRTKAILEKIEKELQSENLGIDLKLSRRGKNLRARDDSVNYSPEASRHSSILPISASRVITGELNDTKVAQAYEGDMNISQYLQVNHSFESDSDQAQIAAFHEGSKPSKSFVMANDFSPIKRQSSVKQDSVNPATLANGQALKKLFQQERCSEDKGSGYYADTTQDSSLSDDDEVNPPPNRRTTGPPGKLAMHKPSNTPRPNITSTRLQTVYENDQVNTGGHEDASEYDDDEEGDGYEYEQDGMAREREAPTERYDSRTVQQVRPVQRHHDLDQQAPMQSSDRRAPSRRSVREDAGYTRQSMVGSVGDKIVRGEIVGEETEIVNVVDDRGSVGADASRNGATSSMRRESSAPSRHPSMARPVNEPNGVDKRMSMSVVPAGVESASTPILLSSRMDQERVDVEDSRIEYRTSRVTSRSKSVTVDRGASESSTMGRHKQRMSVATVSSNSADRAGREGKAVAGVSDSVAARADVSHVVESSREAFSTEDAYTAEDEVHGGGRSRQSLSSGQRRSQSERQNEYDDEGQSRRESQQNGGDGRDVEFMSEPEENQRGAEMLDDAYTSSSHSQSQSRRRASSRTGAVGTHERDDYSGYWHRRGQEQVQTHREEQGQQQEQYDHSDGEVYEHEDAGQHQRERIPSRVDVRGQRRSVVGPTPKASGVTTGATSDRGIGRESGSGSASRRQSGTGTTTNLTAGGVGDKSRGRGQYSEIEVVYEVASEYDDDEEGDGYEYEQDGMAREREAPTERYDSRTVQQVRPVQRHHDLDQQAPMQSSDRRAPSRRSVREDAGYTRQSMVGSVGDKIVRGEIVGEETEIVNVVDDRGSVGADASRNGATSSMRRESSAPSRHPSMARPVNEPNGVDKRMSMSVVPAGVESASTPILLSSRMDQERVDVEDSRIEYRTSRVTSRSKSMTVDRGASESSTMGRHKQRMSVATVSSNSADRAGREGKAVAGVSDSVAARADVSHVVESSREAFSTEDAYTAEDEVHGGGRSRQSLSSGQRRSQSERQNEYDDEGQSRRESQQNGGDGRDVEFMSEPEENQRGAEMLDDAYTSSSHSQSQSRRRASSRTGAVGTHERDDYSGYWHRRGQEQVQTHREEQGQQQEQYDHSDGEVYEHEDAGQHQRERIPSRVDVRGQRRSVVGPTPKASGVTTGATSDRGIGRESGSGSASRRQSGTGTTTNLTAGGVGDKSRGRGQYSEIEVVYEVASEYDDDEEGDGYEYEQDGMAREREAPTERYDSRTVQQVRPVQRHHDLDQQAPMQSSDRRAPSRRSVREDAGYTRQSMVGSVGDKIVRGEIVGEETEIVNVVDDRGSVGADASRNGATSSMRRESSAPSRHPSMARPVNEPNGVDKRMSMSVVPAGVESASTPILLSSRMDQERVDVEDSRIEYRTSRVTSRSKSMTVDRGASESSTMGRHKQRMSVATVSSNSADRAGREGKAVAGVSDSVAARADVSHVVESSREAFSTEDAYTAEDEVHGGGRSRQSLSSGQRRSQSERQNEYDDEGQSRRESQQNGGDGRDVEFMSEPEENQRGAEMLDDAYTSSSHSQSQSRRRASSRTGAVGTHERDDYSGYWHRRGQEQVQTHREEQGQQQEQYDHSDGEVYEHEDAGQHQRERIPSRVDVRGQRRSVVGPTPKASGVTTGATSDRGIGRESGSGSASRRQSGTGTTTNLTAGGVGDKSRGRGQYSEIEVVYEVASEYDDDEEGDGYEYEQDGMAREREAPTERYDSRTVQQVRPVQRHHDLDQQAPMQSSDRRAPSRRSVREDAGYTRQSMVGSVGDKIVRGEIVGEETEIVNVVDDRGSVGADASRNGATSSMRRESSAPSRHPSMARPVNEPNGVDKRMSMSVVPAGVESASTPILLSSRMDQERVDVEDSRIEYRTSRVTSRSKSMTVDRGASESSTMGRHKQRMSVATVSSNSADRAGREGKAVAGVSDSVAARADVSHVVESSREAFSTEDAYTAEDEVHGGGRSRQSLSSGQRRSQSERQNEYDDEGQSRRESQQNGGDGRDVEFMSEPEENQRGAEMLDDAYTSSSHSQSQSRRRASSRTGAVGTHERDDYSGYWHRRGQEQVQTHREEQGQQQEQYDHSDGEVYEHEDAGQHQRERIPSRVDVRGQRRSVVGPTPKASGVTTGATSDRGIGRESGSGSASRRQSGTGTTTNLTAGGVGDKSRGRGQYSEIEVVYEVASEYDDDEEGDGYEYEQDGMAREREAPTERYDSRTVQQVRPVQRHHDLDQQAPMQSSDRRAPSRRSVREDAGYTRQSMVGSVGDKIVRGEIVGEETEIVNVVDDRGSVGADASRNGATSSMRRESSAPSRHPSMARPVNEPNGVDKRMSMSVVPAGVESASTPILLSSRMDQERVDVEDSRIEYRTSRVTSRSKSMTVDRGASESSTMGRHKQRMSVATVSSNSADRAGREGKAVAGVSDSVAARADVSHVVESSREAFSTEDAYTAEDEVHGGGRSRQSLSSGQRRSQSERQNEYDDEGQSRRESQQNGGDGRDVEFMSEPEENQRGAEMLDDAYTSSSHSQSQSRRRASSRTGAVGTHERDDYSGYWHRRGQEQVQTHREEQGQQQEQYDHSDGEVYEHEDAGQHQRERIPSRVDVRGQRRSVVGPTPKASGVTTGATSDRGIGRESGSGSASRRQSGTGTTTNLTAGGVGDKSRGRGQYSEIEVVYEVASEYDDDEEGDGYEYEQDGMAREREAPTERYDSRTVQQVRPVQRHHDLDQQAPMQSSDRRAPSRRSVREDAGYTRQSMVGSVGDKIVRGEIVGEETEIVNVVDDRGSVGADASRNGATSSMRRESSAPSRHPSMARPVNEPNGVDKRMSMSVVPAGVESASTPILLSSRMDQERVDVEDSRIEYRTSRVTSRSKSMTVDRGASESSTMGRHKQRMSVATVSSNSADRAGREGKAVAGVSDSVAARADVSHVVESSREAFSTEDAYTAEDEVHGGGRSRQSLSSGQRRSQSERQNEYDDEGQSRRESQQNGGDGRDVEFMSEPEENQRGAEMLDDAYTSSSHSQSQSRRRASSRTGAVGTHERDDYSGYWHRRGQEQVQTHREEQGQQQEQYDHSDGEVYEHEDAGQHQRERIPSRVDVRGQRRSVVGPTPKASGVTTGATSDRGIGRESGSGSASRRQSGTGTTTNLTAGGVGDKSRGRGQYSEIEVVYEVASEYDDDEEGDGYEYEQDGMAREREAPTERYDSRTVQQVRPVQRHHDLDQQAPMQSSDRRAPSRRSVREDAGYTRHSMVGSVGSVGDKGDFGRFGDIRHWRTDHGSDRVWWKADYEMDAADEETVVSKFARGAAGHERLEEMYAYYLPGRDRRSSHYRHRRSNESFDSVPSHAVVHPVPSKAGISTHNIGKHGKEEYIRKPLASNQEDDAFAYHRQQTKIKSSHWSEQSKALPPTKSITKNAVWPPGMEHEAMRVPKYQSQGRHPLAPPGLEHLVTDEQMSEYWTWLHWYSCWQLYYLQTSKSRTKEKSSSRSKCHRSASPTVNSKPATANANWWVDLRDVAK